MLLKNRIFKFKSYNNGYFVLFFNVFFIHFIFFARKHPLNTNNKYVGSISD